MFVAYALFPFSRQLAQSPDGYLHGRYACDFHATGANETLGTAQADATRPRRLKWYDLIVGSEASPADNAFLYVMQRFTAAGTNTAVVPSPLDPADAATEADAGENNTAEPTYTATLILLEIPLNQRATFRWVCSPGSELVSPATASNGIGIATPTFSAVAITAHLLFEEQ